MAEIIAMEPSDWDAVQAIYKEGIDTGNATFETEAPDWPHWNETHLNEPRLIAKKNGRIVGWAALSSVSNRCVYAGVAEASIYVATHARGHGVGTMLLKALIEASENKGIWTLQGGVFPENKASILLLEHNGFRKVGVREKLGKIDGIWRDVLLMERRSRKTGIK